MPKASYYRKNRERCSSYQKEWAKSHRQQKRKWGRNRARRLREALWIKKATIPCTDCGLFFPPYVLEFDHIEAPHKSAKGNRICMSAIAACSPARVEKEMKKGEWVCANCHKERTEFRHIGLRGPIYTSEGQAWEAVIDGQRCLFIRSGGVVGQSQPEILDGEDHP